MTPLTLEQENRDYSGRGGISPENRSFGFEPAFMDCETGRIFASCFADGRPAAVHVLDGLPQDLVVCRNAAGRVVAVKDSVVAGFTWRGRFFTREQAARLAW
jgi:carbonic anhydrase